MSIDCHRKRPYRARQAAVQGSGRRRRSHSEALRAILSALVSSSAITLASAAGTFYVDVANPACSSAGPGTESVPYCSIATAILDRGGPDTTILVKPGVYREYVVVTKSGSEGHPFVVRALDPSVILDGSLDYSLPALWTHYAGSVWSTPATFSAIWVDDVLLTRVLGSRDQVQPGTWSYDCPSFPCDSSTIYVNIGGDNPASHRTFVDTPGPSGFRLCDRHHVTIEGFTLIRSRGVYLYCTSSHLSILRNTLTYGSESGIYAVDLHNSLIKSNVVSHFANHGIYVLTWSSDSVIEDNECFANTSPSGDGRGIRLAGTYNIKVVRNRLHHNAGTGLHLDHTHGTVSVQNRSWANGENGYAHLYSDGTVHAGDVAWGNVLDGFSVEGGSSGFIFNSISVNNGLSTGRFDLFLDATSASAPGVFSDSNIFWNSSGSQPIKIGSTKYATIAAYAAVSGQDVHSVQADPRFVDPVSADFHLQEGSPAIDSADSSAPGWSPGDAEGVARLDDPARPNAGSGSVTYADRGALEFAPSCGAGVGLTCGTNAGVCAFGTAQCSGERLTCPGGAAPSVEICDGLDNDCDGTIDYRGQQVIGSPILTLVRPPGDPGFFLNWSAVPGATKYDLIRGDLGILRNSSGNFTQSLKECIAGAYAGVLSVYWPNNVFDQNGSWFLVRGYDPLCEGTFDEQPGQVGLRDAEIAASLHSCP